MNYIKDRFFSIFTSIFGSGETGYIGAKDKARVENKVKDIIRMRLSDTENKLGGAELDLVKVNELDKEPSVVECQEGINMYFKLINKDIKAMNASLDRTDKRNKEIKERIEKSRKERKAQI